MNGFLYMRVPVSIFIAILFLISVNLTAQPDENDKPSNPFDPNFCGGERVYPRIGVNFATVCGPKNTVTVGRRGLFEWFFDTMDDKKPMQGKIQLPKKLLQEITLMAEVAMIADPVPAEPEKVIYVMGFDFSGRNPKSFKASFNNRQTPANELLRKLLSLVPEDQKPNLPECGTRMVFDPTLHHDDRLPLLELLNSDYLHRKYIVNLIPITDKNNEKKNK